LYYSIVLYVFFFQAEDGIRDDLVTGVQTCALPIWSRSPRSLRLISWCWSLLLFGGSPALSAGLFAEVIEGIWTHATHVERYLSRSEERRVGEEWRLRGLR